MCSHRVVVLRALAQHSGTDSRPTTEQCRAYHVQPRDAANEHDDPARADGVRQPTIAIADGV